MSDPSPSNEFFLIHTYFPLKSKKFGSKKLVVRFAGFKARLKKFKLGMDNVQGLSAASLSQAVLNNKKYVTGVSGNNAHLIPIMGGQVIIKAVNSSSSHICKDWTLITCANGSTKIRFIDLRGVLKDVEVTANSSFKSTYQSGRYSTYGRNLRVWNGWFLYLNQQGIIELYDIEKTFVPANNGTQVNPITVGTELEDFDVKAGCIHGIKMDGRFEIIPFAPSNQILATLKVENKQDPDNPLLFSTVGVGHWCSLVAATKKDRKDDEMHLFSIDHSKSRLRVADHYIILKKESSRNDISHHIKFTILRGVELAIVESVFGHISAFGIFKGRLHLIEEKFMAAPYSDYFNSLEVVDEQIFITGSCGLRKVKITW